MKTKLILSAFLLAIANVSCFAQWQEDAPHHSTWGVGVSGGLDYNIPSVSKGCAADYNYKGMMSFNVGVVGRYQFIDWLAVRADVRLSQRNYKMERDMSCLKGVYTEHDDLYLHLPIVADLSVGGNKLRGHFYLGGYAGYWLNAHRKGDAIAMSIDGSGDALFSFSEKMDFDSDRDNRFNAGVTGGLGLSYLCGDHIEVMAETFLMYDLTKSNKTACVSNPRYNTTSDFNLGIIYNF